MATNALPKVGSRIQATAVIPYTLYEFEEHPLVVQPGDQGKVVSVDVKRGVMYLEWDNDPRKDIKKVIYFNETNFCIL